MYIYIRIYVYMSQRCGAGVYRFIQDGAWTRNAAGQTQPQMPL